MRDVLREEAKKRKPYNLSLQMKANLAAADIDFEPGHLPKLSVLHKISSEGTRKIEDVIGQLHLMARERPFIRSLKLFPDIFISFWTDSQINFYNHFCMKNYVVMSLDDTGDIVKNLVPGTQLKKKTIKLFQFIMKSTDGGPSLPTSQLLSSKADIPAVTEWITDWNKKVFRPPDLLVMDCAAVLHFSACRVFNGISLKDYYSNCWLALNGRKFAQVKTLLRIDRSHFVQMIIRWLNKNKVTGDVKELYARSICRMIDEENLLTVANVFLTLLLISLAPYDTPQMFACKEFLGAFIAGLKPRLLFDFSNEMPDNQDWFKVVMQKVAVQHFEKSKIKNPFRLLKLGDYLLYLSRRIFLWTNVFTHFCHCQEAEPNSNNCESFFSKLKNTILEKGIFEADIFLQKFLDYLDGAIYNREGKKN